MAATTFHRELALAFARFLIPQAPPSLSDNLWDTFMNSPVALEIQKRNVDHVVHGVVFSERTTPVKKRAKAVPVPITDAAVPVADAAVPVADAAVPVADAAVPVADAAVPVADAAVPIADAAITPKKKRKTAPSEPGAPKKPRQPSAKKAAAAAAAAAVVATVLESASPVPSTAAVADTESITDMDSVFSPELSGVPSLLNDLDTEAYDANEAVVEEFVEVYVDGVLFYQNKDATQFYDATYHPCPCPIH